MFTKKICLWSSPRNISTAFMYSFAQRPDTIVFDEPLYAHYLKVTGSNHPGREEVLASQQNDGEKVVREIILKEYEKPIAFFKQMAHHLVAPLSPDTNRDGEGAGVREDFLLKVDNIIFIRNPKQIISSYAQVRADVTMTDIGIAKQWQLFSYLKKNNHKPVVLDAGELLQNPEKVLTDLCSSIQIPFYNSMLHWNTGPKQEDGVWAKYWYANVHQSTGFEKQKTSERALPKYLESLYEESKMYYDKLFPYSIKA